MAWTPQYQVVDLAPVKRNLLAFIEANNADALDWANGGAGLSPFKKVYPTAAGRLRSIFPNVALITWGFGNADLADEAADAILRFRFEVELTGTPDDLPGLMEAYDLALRSMLVNAPVKTSLPAGSKTITRLWADDDAATTFDLIAQLPNNAWYQRFQTEIEYKAITNFI